MKTTFFIILSFLCWIANLSTANGQVVYPSASNVTNSFICLNCSVANVSQALNNNPADYANIHIGLSLISTVDLDLTFSPAVTSGNTISLIVEDPTALLDLLGGVSYTLWNGSTAVSNTGWNIMPYNGSSTQKVLYTTASSAFTTLRISLTGFLTFAKNLRIYSAAAANGYVPLPVTFLHFAGTAEPNAVNLRWSTTYEKDNRSFEILRSADGVEWSQVGMLEGKGNSSELITYTYTDQNPSNGLNYYRLQQTDYNGASSYSKIICVSVNAISAAAMRLYPNPLAGSSVVWLEIGEGQAIQEPVQVHLSDLQGRSFGTQTVTLNGNQAPLTIGSDLPKGIYMVRIETTQGSRQERLVIH